MSEQLRAFAKEFFTKLGASVASEGTRMVVTNVPHAFQKFYGKHEPYTLVFSQADEAENTEVLVKGSYMLKAMTAYLDNRGQTTLLKLHHEDDPRATILGSYDCSDVVLTHVTSKKSYKQFARFTFQTVFKYLNDKEVLTNEVFVNDSGVFDFDVGKYQTEEGKKRDVTTDDVKPLYVMGKEHVRVLLQDKIASVSKILEDGLEKELKRVKDHYSSQIKEIDDKLAKDLASLRELENTNKDVKDKDKKMQRLREQIQFYQKDNRREQLLQESSFFEKAEVKKHGLALDTKLLNTTILYYPVYEYGVFLKQDGTERLISLSYDPVKDELSSLSCDVCSKELQKLVLDAGGHLICADCATTCQECGNASCAVCLKHSCAVSGKKLCKNCVLRCQKCSKTKAKQYMLVHPITKIARCIGCWKQCPQCHSHVDESEMRGNVCHNCARKAVSQNVRKQIFSRDDW